MAVPQGTEGVQEPPQPVGDELWYVGAKKSLPEWEGVEGAVMTGRKVAEEIVSPS